MKHSMEVHNMQSLHLHNQNNLISFREMHSFPLRFEFRKTHHNWIYLHKLHVMCALEWWKFWCFQAWQENLYICTSLILLLFHKIYCRVASSKGQLISKQDCQAIISPKKTNVGFLPWRFTTSRLVQKRIYLLAKRR